MASWAAMEGRLRELVAAKCSGGDIARALNEQFGANLTRSAVMGAAHRFGLKLSGTPGGAGRPRGGAKASAPADGASKPKPPRKKKVVEKPPEPEPVVFPMNEFPPLEPEPMLGFDDPLHIVNLKAGQCRWVYGDASEGLCCGAKTVVGQSWCSDHKARVFQPAMPRRRVKTHDENRRERETIRNALMRFGAL